MKEPFVPNTCHVALLAGGTSAEREISLSSGDGAEVALREAGFPVTRFDPAKPEDMDALAQAAAAGEVQVAFICLHGKGGEDGTIQATLEAMGLPYTGSGVEASRAAMDKNSAKDKYAENHLPTAIWIHMEGDTIRLAQERNVLPAVAEKAAGILGLPCVVKAVNQGSTQGLYIVKDAAELAGAMLEALTFDDSIILEKFVPGREFTVAVLGNDDPEALPVIQIVPKNAFYDFEAKYAPGGSQHLCPAPIPDELTARLKDLAVSAHKALGCRGMSRTDFIVDGDGEAWILETNTIPGMTKTSLLPDAARVAGMSFAELCTRLVRLALE